MNKLFIVIIIILLIILLFFIPTEQSDIVRENVVEKRSIFISYIELERYIKYKDENTAKKNIDLMIKNIKDLGFNMVILQVRSFSDAIYKSDIYPWSMTISSSEGGEPSFAVLKYFIDKAHKNNLNLHAWINPYRVRSNNDVSSITEGNPAYKYINTDVLYVNNGIYYNPSKEEVNNLILNGISELIDNYDIDGIVFDDYFYPDDNIDIKDYEEYLKTHKYITGSEYRLKIINKLVSEVYKLTKKNKILFGISPSGNIENNYDGIYADVKRWGSSSSYVDYLMPQIYYGFYNESQSFSNVLKEWDKIVTSPSVKLMPALAFYKVGIVDSYAKSGSDEWINNSDIIMREIMLSRNLSNYDGFGLYRYDYLFNNELQTETTMMEIKNMKEIIK